MRESNTLILSKKVLTRITQRGKLDLGLSEKKLVKKHLESNEFNHRLKLMLEEKDFTCKSVYSLGQELFFRLDQEHQIKDWLYKVYQFALSRSFPEAIELATLKIVSSNTRKTFLLYLELLRVISGLQKSSNDNSFQGKYPLHFLTTEEKSKLENSSEYKRFIKAFKDDYIYEMMKLSQEVLNYSTLDHICGVNWIALNVARQLSKKGIPVDLGKVSGAAIGHDIGKYGCKKEEVERTPYLHYYYTDKWFKRHNLPYLGHIAVNHSVWDLELANLPLESLILIYSDFRVKDDNNHNNSGKMKIFTLRDSFQIILEKLDNLNKQKKERYYRVYSKLKDFEDYLLDLGINVDIEKEGIHLPEEKIIKHYSLMQSKEIIQNLKYLSIEHNIRLMYQLRSEDSLNSLLELTQNDHDWKNLREYIQILNEYSTYLTQKQKLITLRFLYEQLIHPEDEIRRRSAKLIGKLIATFEEEYRKEIPKNVKLDPPEINGIELFQKYLKKFLLPDHKKPLLLRYRILHSTDIMISSLFNNCQREQNQQFIKIIWEYYRKADHNDKEIQLVLLKIGPHLPVHLFEEYLNEMIVYLSSMLTEENIEFRLLTLENINILIPRIDQKTKFLHRLEKYFSEKVVASVLPAENYLKWKIVRLLNLEKDLIEKYYKFYKNDLNKIQTIFLSNLKTSTCWIVKKIQIELLLNYVLGAKREEIYTALHFCNILKVSGEEAIRNLAGQALIKLISNLSLEQRNEIIIELLRALEMEDYQFTKYIPYYLGQLINYLPPRELEDIIYELVEKVKQTEPRLTSLLLRTIGIIIAFYPPYRERFAEEESVFQNRLQKIVGILLNGLVHYSLQVRQEAFRVIGRELFGSKHLSLEEKNRLFRLMAKKILTLLNQVNDTGLMFLSNCNGLSYIYKFISDYSFSKGSMDVDVPSKVAFFPGSFDPFSLSHKEIVKTLASLGFEVYLAVDEFSWSKRTQAHFYRKNIINLSIADELKVFLYPEDLPVNIANSDDLKLLRENFPSSEVFIVVGSDVLTNASSYQKEKTQNSIHTFPHIIFDRLPQGGYQDNKNNLSEVLKKIDKEIIKLNLVSEYEEISSSQIRGYIDENRDISKFVDPLAQKYIYANSLYQREPQFKGVMQTISLDIQLMEDVSLKEMEELCEQIFSYSKKKEILRSFKSLINKSNFRILVLKDLEHQGKVLGFSAFHWVRSSNLYQEFKNNLISEYIRENAVGRIILIEGVFITNRVKNNLEIENLEQIVLTETLSFCISKDYGYAIFRNILDFYTTGSLNENLELMGFYSLPFKEDKKTILVVDINKPCIINLETESVIKEPFNQSSKIKEAIIKSRKKILKSITTFYPGNIVLPFQINFINQMIVKKICQLNNVSFIPQVPRVLGEAMCVPFGKILHKMVVPNTVTKSLHTEKTFHSDVRTFNIDAFPNYLSLDNQVKVVRSFNMPVILVDDYLHKGYRIKTLEPLFHKYSIQVKKIVVGALSGSGKEIASILNREVDSVYFIPNLRLWFNESELYPFIGGDAIKRARHYQGNLVKSINLILPYAFPSFIKNVSGKIIYEFSKICMENAWNILKTLEEEFQGRRQQKLTLSRLGEIIIYPRCPDQGEGLEYNLNISPSHYLLNDLELLERNKEIVNR